MKIKYSSDARVILATFFPVYKEVILERSPLKKSANQTMFDQDQIDAAYLDPHCLFLIKDIARVGVRLLKLHKSIFDLRTNLLTQKEFIAQALSQLEEKVNNYKLEPKKAKEINNKLLRELDKTNNSINTLNNLLESEIKTLLGQFNNMMTLHDDEWREHRKIFTDKMIKLLEEKDLLFSQEKAELLKMKPMAVILQETPE